MAQFNGKFIEWEVDRGDADSIMLQWQSDGVATAFPGWTPIVFDADAALAGVGVVTAEWVDQNTGEVRVSIASLPGLMSHTWHYFRVGLVPPDDDALKMRAFPRIGVRVV